MSHVNSTLVMTSIEEPHCCLTNKNHNRKQEKSGEKSQPNVSSEGNSQSSG